MVCSSDGWRFVENVSRNSVELSMGVKVVDVSGALLRVVLSTATVFSFPELHAIDMIAIIKANSKYLIRHVYLDGRIRMTVDSITTFLLSSVNCPLSFQK